MNNLIKYYINKLTIKDVSNFAISKNIHLSNDELNFTYNFIKNNYEEIFIYKKNFNIDKYKNYFSEENFPKIKTLLTEYLIKFNNYL